MLTGSRNCWKHGKGYMATATQQGKVLILDADTHRAGLLSERLRYLDYDPILFDVDVDAKYERALANLGVDPAMLSSEAGHA